MTDRSRSRHVFWRDAKQSLNKPLSTCQPQTRMAPHAHLYAWLFWAALAACQAQEARDVVPVSVMPNEDAGTGDASAEDADKPMSSSMRPQACTAKDVSRHKVCTQDADCQVFAYRPSCCATQVVVGAAIDDADELQACVDNAPPVCADCPVEPTRAEDGRVVVGDDVVARCVSGECTAQVETRACGSNQRCQADELCVMTENVKDPRPGDAPAPDNDALKTYTCEPNPCGADIECGCAQSLCDERKDRLRQCEITFSADADVVCRTVET